MRQRITLSIPDDPRFDEMQSFLDRAAKRGRRSPVPNMLAEWALLGFLLTTGRMKVDVPLPVLPECQEDDEQEGSVSELLDESGWNFA